MAKGGHKRQPYKFPFQSLTNFELATQAELVAGDLRAEGRQPRGWAKQDDQLAHFLDVVADRLTPKRVDYKKYAAILSGEELDALLDEADARRPRTPEASSSPLPCAGDDAW